MGYKLVVKFCCCNNCAKNIDILESFGGTHKSYASLKVICLTNNLTLFEDCLALCPRPCDKCLVDSFLEDNIIYTHESGCRNVYQ